jgi:hypothetical protein
MKTAVDWLEEKLIDIFNFKKGECFEIEQAKEMEKQQIIDAYSEGYINGIMENRKMAEQYYNEKYNNNGK